MDGKSVTALVIVGTAVLLAAYDFVVIRLCGPPASISLVLHEMVQRHPILGLALGIAIGHVFWPLLELVRK